MSQPSASTLRCPSCGAPAAADAARCGYCRSRLATASCPTCFGLLFQGAAYCPHCGAARSRSESSEAQPTHCPACRAHMHWVRVGTTDLLECGECDGTWMEAATFERLCADREGQAALLPTRAAPVPADTAVGPAGPVHYRPCPRCGKLMNRINFGRLSGTVVDVCRGHGTFLDRGELHQVVRFIMEGGLDRARQAERDQLIEEQRRLQALGRGPAPISVAGSLGNWDELSLRKFLAALFERS